MFWFTFGFCLISVVCDLICVLCFLACSVCLDLVIALRVWCLWLVFDRDSCCWLLIVLWCTYSFVFVMWSDTDFWFDVEFMFCCVFRCLLFVDGCLRSGLVV